MNYQWHWSSWKLEARSFEDYGFNFITIGPLTISWWEIGE